MTEEEKKISDWVDKVALTAHQTELLQLVYRDNGSGGMRLSGFDDKERLCQLGLIEKVEHPTDFGIYRATSYGKEYIRRINGLTRDEQIRNLCKKFIGSVPSDMKCADWDELSDLLAASIKIAVQRTSDYVD